MKKEFQSPELRVMEYQNEVAMTTSATVLPDEEL